MLPAKPHRTSAWKNAVPDRDEQSAMKRGALIREAARAFNARGYYNTSLEDVAKQLGVTKAALYYYVKGKEEILLNVTSSQATSETRRLPSRRRSRAPASSE